MTTRWSGPRATTTWKKPWKQALHTGLLAVMAVACGGQHRRTASGAAAVDAGVRIAPGTIDSTRASPAPIDAGDAGDAGDADNSLVDRGRTPAHAMSYRYADWLTRPERDAEEQPDRMLDALSIRAGMTVADIGAGVGYHTWRLARRVGPTGRVFATDIQPEMLDLMRRNLRERRVTNVTPVLSGESSTGLPDGVIDLALMVDVFHELSEPEVYLHELRRALRPDGRLVLIEFRAEDPNVPVRPEHRMTAEQVVREMSRAGFRLIQREEFLPIQHILVFGLAP